jgi:aminoglycoside/choline kinase family phosphotransferase
VVAGGVSPAPRDEAQRIAELAGAALREDVASVTPLVAGIGLRRFYRVSSASGRSVIARIESDEDPAGRPTRIPPEPPLEPIRALLERAGLPVPRACGGAPGIALLEDFGDESLYARAQRGSAEETEWLVARALDLVPRLQRVADDGSGVEAFSRRLDAPYFTYKADLFARFSLADALGRAPTAAEDAALREAFAWIGAEIARAPQRLSHRDFQSQNIFVRSGGALGLIDLQGAFLAPPAYDLVCLLRDSYLALPEAFVDAELERVRPALPDVLSAAELRAHFDLLTLTRKGKDHARFLYAAHERGDRRYLGFAPRTARLVAQAARRAAALDARIARVADMLALWEAACAE